MTKGTDMSDTTIIDRPTWLAMYAMGHGGFTTPEVEEARYQKDVARGSLLPDMTSQELTAVFKNRLTLEDIKRYRADPSLWDTYDPFA
jgi:hypothetical protein